MTEAEWLACSDPRRVVSFVWHRMSGRKLRLFAVACCHRVWRLIRHDRCRGLVQAAEKFADGEINWQQLQVASGSNSEGGYDCWGNSACCAAREAGGAMYLMEYEMPAWYHAASAAGQRAASAANRTPRSVDLAAGQTESDALAHVLRDLLGNVFRPRIKSRWGAWKGGTIPKLAQVIYDERAFGRLPILADALEDAGCANRDVLDHCRGPGPHVRGCWAVDLVLGSGEGSGLHPADRSGRFGGDR